MISISGIHASSTQNECCQQWAGPRHPARTLSATNAFCPCGHVGTWWLRCSSPCKENSKRKCNTTLVARPEHHLSMNSHRPARRKNDLQLTPDARMRPRHPKPKLQSRRLFFSYIPCHLARSATSTSRREQLKSTNQHASHAFVHHAAWLRRSRNVALPTWATKKTQAKVPATVLRPAR